MKTIINLILFAAITTFFFSCGKEDSNTVSQDKIYAEYELFYDKNQDKTYASAVFKFSNATGTQLQLSAPSEIRFNGDLVPYDPTFAYYRKEYSGLVNTGTFKFKDTDGVEYSNTVSLANVINNPVIDTIKRSAGAFTYTWTGDALATNELVGLTIGNTTVTTNFQVFLQGTVGSTNIVLPISQLNLLPIGSSYCQLDRQIETNALSVTSAGGKIRGKYRGMNTTLYIK